jgi:hypothetical protein
MKSISVLDFLNWRIRYTEMDGKFYFSIFNILIKISTFFPLSLFVYYITSPVEGTKPPVLAFEVVSPDIGFAVLYLFPDLS